MKIAIYGGSFNPPHCGHVEAARTAQEFLQPDKFLIIPASIPPHKELADGSPDAGARAGDARADGSADRYPDDGPRAAGDGRNHPARRGNDGNACP